METAHTSPIVEAELCDKQLRYGICLQAQINSKRCYASAKAVSNEAIST